MTVRQLLPAVSFLANKHHIARETLASIFPTGPKGTLLKGDILAFLSGRSETSFKELRFYSTNVNFMGSQLLSSYSPALVVSRACAKGRSNAFNY